MKSYFFLFSLIICFSCSDSIEPEVQKNGTLEHKTETRLSADDSSSFNDPFMIESVYIRGTELWIEVGYSGGCEEHDFIVAWPEAITMIYPPDFGVTLYHNANGDLCEVFKHETLKIDLTDTPVGKFSPATIAEMRLTVVNGSKPEESKSTR